MKMNKIIYKPIGIIRTPFKKPLGTPIQPSAGKGIEGIVELFPEYTEGLKDLEGFSHIILIYHFHLVKRTLLKVTPYMDDELRGIFATRAPPRPNPIGISITRLVKIQGNKIYVKDIDIVDGTPLLDIKPYVPEFDVKENVKIGWLRKRVERLKNTKDNGRFYQ